MIPIRLFDNFIPIPFERPGGDQTPRPARNHLTHVTTAPYQLRKPASPARSTPTPPHRSKTALQLQRRQAVKEGAPFRGITTAAPLKQI